MRNKFFEAKDSSNYCYRLLNFFRFSEARKIFIPTSALIFLFLLFNASFLPKAHAQDVSLGIYPPILKINLTPPTSVSQGIVIKNFTDDALRLEVVFKAFKNSSSNNGELEYIENPNEIPGNDPHIFDKMQLFDGSHVVSVLSLAPQEEKTLTLHIGIPEDEPASDYYFSILFIKQGITNDQSNVSAVTSAIGTNVLVSIGPQTATTGFIKEFSAPLLLQHGPVNFKLLLQNASTHFINPKGTILIQNMFGQYVGKLNLLPVNILERSARYIPDDKNLNSSTAIWPEKVLFGPYSAKLTIALSDTGPLFTRTIYFFALPTEVLIGFILAILLGVAIFWRVRERLKKM